MAGKPAEHTEILPQSLRKNQEIAAINYRCPTNCGGILQTQLLAPKIANHTPRNVTQLTILFDLADTGPKDYHT
jgi:hypothetical protein